MANQVLDWLRTAGAHNLKQTGVDNYKSTCPDCDPTGQWQQCFAINTRTGLYVCYRESCGARGHLKQLLADYLGYTWAEAKTAVASVLDWEEVKEEDLAIPAFKDRHRKPEAERSLEMEAQIGLYKFMPQYMVDRGFSKEILRRFEIGYDFDKKRVVFPVRAANGPLLGFSTRSTREDDFPKYLHLDFRKSTTLYGESYGGGAGLASQSVGLVVGEGNADALALQQLLPGDEYKAVATLGARVSDVQVRSMYKYPRVYLCFDKDLEGWKARARVGNALREMGHRGVYCLEFPDFPHQKDPGDIVKLLQQYPRQVRHRVRPFTGAEPECSVWRLTREKRQ